MDHKQVPPDLLIAVDACRADSADAQMPEIAAAIAGHPPWLVEQAREYIEQTDRAIAAATQRVPVPEGLAERILANLAHQPPTTVCPPELDAAEPHQAARRPTRPRPWAAARLRRAPRPLLITGGALVAAATLLAVIVLRPQSDVEVAYVEQFARDFYTADDHNAELLTTAQPPEFPFDSQLAARVYGWRKLSAGFLDCPAVAYELANRRGAARATLYVLGARTLHVAGIGPSPLMPASTGGITVGIWQSGGQVYVLVVQGGPREFQSFFPQSADVA